MQSDSSSPQAEPAEVKEPEPIVAKKLPPLIREEDKDEMITVRQSVARLLGEE